MRVLRQVNMISGLAQAALFFWGYWEGPNRSWPELGVVAACLLGTALIAAGFYNRFPLRWLAQRRAFLTAAFCSAALQGYFLLLVLGCEDNWERVVRAPLPWVFLWPIGASLYFCLIVVPALAIYMLCLGLAFRFLYNRRDYLPEAV